MNCPKCGFANSIHDNVCRNCGEPLANNSVENIFGEDILKPIAMNNLEDIDNSDTLDENKNLNTVIEQEVVTNEVTIDPKKNEVEEVPTSNIEINNMSSNENGVIEADIIPDDPVINKEPIISDNTNDLNVKVKEPFDMKKTLVIVGGIVFAALLILIAVVILTKSNNDYQGVTPTVNEDYKINFSGYDIKIPNTMKYEISNNSLIITDKDTTWMTVIEVSNYNYSELLVNKDKIKASYEKMGMVVGNMTEKTYDNVKYLVAEMKKSDTDLVVGITKASTTQSFVVISLKPDYSLSYDGLNKVANILSSSKYTGENKTTNIKSDFFDFSAIKA